MIAHAKKLRAQTLQDRFLDMLPAIRKQARLAFRGENPELREELIAEVIANCFVAFVRLMDRGLDDAKEAFDARQRNREREVAGSGADESNAAANRT